MELKTNFTAPEKGRGQENTQSTTKLILKTNIIQHFLHIWEPRGISLELRY